MKDCVKKEIEDIIKQVNLNCTVEEFKDYVDWYHISHHQYLSEDFIREFKDKVCWINISCYQKLSEDFIKEFKDKVSWRNISVFQKFSEDFIKEFQNKIIWGNLPKEQQNFKQKWEQEKLIQKEKEKRLFVDLKTLKTKNLSIVSGLEL